MTVTSSETGSVVATYLLLRKAIGWIGLLLPLVVIVGELAFGSGPLPNSLSDFYYTPMRNILVGALCVLGVFLLLYDVTVKFDRWVTNAAGIGVLGVAFLPGSPAVPHLTTSEEVIGNLHVVFASIAFIGLAVTMWRFGEAISDGPGASAPSSRATLFYRVSACLMMVFILGSGAAILLPLSIQNSTLAIYDTEALAIVTFGVSWLVKGNGMQPLASSPAMAGMLGRPVGGGSAAPDPATPLR